MCRKTVTHHMHHDVRQLMITSLDHEGHTVYANPLHTVFHQCEIDTPLPEQWLLNNPFPTCEYHSCCRVFHKVHYCSEFVNELLDTTSSSEDDFEPEPEDCPYFIQEHRHKRLEYFGHPESYPMCCPATWHEGVKELEKISFPYFRQNREKLFEFATALFLSCEKYYQLEKDAETLFLVYRDFVNNLPRGDPRIAIAEVSIMNIQNKLTEKKNELFSRMVWAKGLDVKKYSRGFIPIWWLRMWALQQEMEEEEQSDDYLSDSDYSSEYNI
ncbi:uncharacterized protein F4817DRAFT_363687 [Daldinia loculata]|uniref:uncharacterized protein n=1 Tax=Daldinia loculata TaxID=103429 RepID=UPI0020C3080D|nr:uncharacterized protein F4817DRAFT_363687 [Daldinia loculata]KAI1649351.1 hypothetical protein F4817DRAFT_363687 [Daldinia loculata]